MLPPDVQAYRLMRAGRLADALPFAEQAVAGSARCLPAHGMLATLLLHLGRANEAEAVVCRALEGQLGSADAYDALAHVSLLLGRHERSNALYRKVVEMAPGEARFWYNLACSERSVGRLVEAESACDRAIALDATHYASYLLRSELRVQSSESSHIAQLQSQLSRPDLPAPARVPLGYALAKELDDLGRFDEAFHWFAQAAGARRRQLAYDVSADERKIARIGEVFPQEPLRDELVGVDSSRFIFIIGLPRSGTTLLEHILTGLTGVRSNGETDNFSRALIAAAPAGAEDIFSRAARASPQEVARHYVRLAAGAAAAEKIVEKMPLNYLYLGAIRRALPRAPVLLVTREPLDSCFAMFRTLFAAAYPFSYDFEDLARYYAAFARLIQHWRECFEDSLQAVSYEELVKDPQRIGAQVAHYCGLDWKAEAIDVHRSASVSLTASAAQIRRPIYGSSSGRWHHYHSHLAPLIEALRRRAVSLPTDA
jgi:tetratricopeptide (TPR) repeat protein